MNNFHAIGSLISIITGIIGLIQYWHTNKTMGYISIVVLIIGGLWIRYIQGKEIPLGGMSRDEVITTFNRYADGIERDRIEKDSIVEKIENLNAPTLIGPDKLEIENPDDYAQRIGNWLYRLTKQTKITSFLFQKVFLRRLVGVTVSYSGDLFVVPSPVLFLWGSVYIVISLVFIFMHIKFANGYLGNSIYLMLYNKFVLLFNLRSDAREVLSIIAKFALYDRFFYLTIAVIYQFYGIVPKVFSIYAWLGLSGRTAKDTIWININQFSRILLTNVILFTTSIMLHFVSFSIGLIMDSFKVTNSGFEIGFVAGWSVIAFIGIRRLSYTLFMLFLGGYVIVIMSSVVNTCK